MVFNKCLRCKRPLRTEESRKLGYGKICYKSMKKEKIKQEVLKYD